MCRVTRRRRRKLVGENDGGEDVDGRGRVVAESGEDDLAKAGVERVLGAFAVVRRPAAHGDDALVELVSPEAAVVVVEGANEETAKAAGDGGSLVVGRERAIEGRGWTVKGGNVADVAKTLPTVLLVLRPVVGLTLARAVEAGATDVPALAAAEERVFAIGRTCGRESSIVLMMKRWRKRREAHPKTRRRSIPLPRVPRRVPFPASTEGTKCSLQCCPKRRCRRRRSGGGSWPSA